MRCSKCGTENRDDAKFCRGCGEILSGRADSVGKPPKRRKVPILLVLIILVILLGVVGAVVYNGMTGDAGDASDLLDESNRHVFNEQVLNETIASTSDAVMSTNEVSKALLERGFESVIITSNYDMSGAPLGDMQLDTSSTDKHPLYSVYYITSSGAPWIIYVCNDSFMADPLFLYDPSTPGYMIVEDDYVTSYSSNQDKFIQSIPAETELVLKKVARIDATTLDGLDTNGIEGL